MLFVSPTGRPKTKFLIEIERGIILNLLSIYKILAGVEGFTLWSENPFSCCLLLPAPLQYDLSSLGNWE